MSRQQTNTAEDFAPPGRHLYENPSSPTTMRKVSVACISNTPSITDANHQKLKRVFTKRHYGDQGKFESTYVQIECTWVPTDHEQDGESQQKRALSLQRAESNFAPISRWTTMIGPARLNTPTLPFCSQICAVQGLALYSRISEVCNLSSVGGCASYLECLVRQNTLQTVRGKQRIREVRFDTAAAHDWEDITENTRGRTKERSGSHARRSRYRSKSERRIDVGFKNREMGIETALEEKRQRLGCHAAKCTFLCRMVLELRATPLRQGCETCEEDNRCLGEAMRQFIQMSLRGEPMRKSGHRPSDAGFM